MSSRAQIASALSAMNERLEHVEHTVSTLKEDAAGSRKLLEEIKTMLVKEFEFGSETRGRLIELADSQGTRLATQERAIMQHESRIYKLEHPPNGSAAE